MRKLGNREVTLQKHTISSGYGREYSTESWFSPLDGNSWYLFLIYKQRKIQNDK